MQKYQNIHISTENEQRLEETDTTIPEEAEKTTEDTVTEETVE